MTKQERIEQLKSELSILTKDCSFPEDKKNNWRWVWKQPISSFTGCSDVNRVIEIISTIRVLSNDCIIVKG
jgi:hypothetical protein